MATEILRSIIETLREIDNHPTPVIFTSPHWNGMCMRVEETGDLAVGDTAIMALREMSARNECAPDPLSLAHKFAGIEIVPIMEVLTDPSHRLTDRAKPLAGMLFEAAMDALPQKDTTND